MARYAATKSKKKAPLVIQDRTSPPPRTNLLRTVLLAVGLLVLGVLFYRFAYKSPQRVLSAAFDNLADAHSVTMDVQSADTNVRLIGHVTDEDKPSRFTLSLRNPEKKDETVGVESVVDKKNIYIRLTEFEKEELDAMVGETFPFVVSTRTYRLVQPVLLGERWLHIPLPEEATHEVKEDKEDKAKDLFPSIDEKEEQELEMQAKKAVIFRKYEQNALFEGKRYQKIVIGFKKEELVKLLEKLKDLDIDVKVSQINAAIRLVKAGKNWNDDLVTFHIDNNDRIVHVSLAAPHIPAAEVKKSIEEGTRDQQFFNSSALQREDGKEQYNFFTPDKGSTVKKLGTIRLSNYNNIPSLTIPKELIEGQVVWEQAMADFLPLMQAMMGEAALPSPNEQ